MRRLAIAVSRGWSMGNAYGNRSSFVASVGYIFSGFILWAIAVALVAERIITVIKALIEKIYVLQVRR